ncbi:MAG: hypothetical protein PVI62_20135, partial [Desulfobacterales bacterium]
RSSFSGDTFKTSKTHSYGYRKSLAIFPTGKLCSCRINLFFFIIIIEPEAGLERETGTGVYST